MQTGSACLQIVELFVFDINGKDVGSVQVRAYEEEGRRRRVYGKSMNGCVKTLAVFLVGGRLACIRG